jgi:hypothetical protein
MQIGGPLLEHRHELEEIRVGTRPLGQGVKVIVHETVRN